MKNNFTLILPLILLSVDFLKLSTFIPNYFAQFYKWVCATKEIKKRPK